MTILLMADGQTATAKVADATAGRQNAARRNERVMENRLDQSEQWLRMLIDTAEDYAIFSINPEGKIASWNRGAVKLFCYREEEIVGQDFAIIFTPEDQADGVPQEEIQRAQREGYCPDDRWHIRKD